MALDGDPVALRLCMDRLVPVRRERVTVALPLPHRCGKGDEHIVAGYQGRCDFADRSGSADQGHHRPSAAIGDAEQWENFKSLFPGLDMMHRS